MSFSDSQQVYDYEDHSQSESPSDDSYDYDDQSQNHNQNIQSYSQSNISVVRFQVNIYGQYHQSLHHQSTQNSSLNRQYNHPISSNNNRNHFSFRTTNIQNQENNHFFSSEQQSLSNSQQSPFQIVNQFQQEDVQDNFESPFFPLPTMNGLSNHEIDLLPSMIWGKVHNLLNRGQKCSICLQEYIIGDTLRVMACLHRYHSQCLDQWLSVKATCPNCRNYQN